MTKDDFIQSITINEANFDYIKKNKVINGTLHTEIKRVLKQYAKEKCKEQENRIVGEFIFKGDFLVGTKDRKILDKILKKSRPKFD